MPLENNSDNPIESLLYVNKDLFPCDYGKNKLPIFLHEAMKQISKKMNGEDLARIPGRFDNDIYDELGEKYGILPKQCDDSLKSIQEIARDFTSGAPLWRSSKLQYNVGSAVNVAAAALYALALDINIYNINDGLAGAALIAEKAVARILASLADVNHKESFGLFTFGGTATNLYALKIATRLVCPKSGIEGIPRGVKFLITEDAHFSHAVATDWLGVGTENIVIIQANKDRTSNITDAERKMRDIFEEGGVLAAIVLNGGTTYDHAIDDILAFIELRDRLVAEYSLSYKPHLHVDAVIGWAWLMFKDYDFEKNDLKISERALENIKMQYDRIKYLKHVDSWGVDFHKGVGACPVPCSIIMMNNKMNFMRLSKKNDPLTFAHQVANEFSFDSPSEYTLETSRSGGAPLAALAALHTLGQYGYQSYLANLISMSLLTKELIAQSDIGIAVCNTYSIGYVTMIRMYPPELAHDSKKEIELSIDAEDLAEFTNRVNKYMKEFFSWDYETRMKKNQGVEYSYSSTYIKTPSGIKIPAIKFYPTSPNIRKKHIYDAVKTLKEQKEKFDSEVWKKNRS